jgi:pimeloyl-ACP methyl ester carboxylesterase
MGGLLALALAAERADVRGLFLIEPVYTPQGGAHASGALARVARFALAPLVCDFERGGSVTRFLSRAIFTQAFEDRDSTERAWSLQRMQVPTEYPKMLYEAFEGRPDFRIAPSRARSHSRSSCWKAPSRRFVHVFRNWSMTSEPVWGTVFRTWSLKEDTIFSWTGRPNA